MRVVHPFLPYNFCTNQREEEKRVGSGLRTVRGKLGWNPRHTAAIRLYCSMQSKQLTEDSKEEEITSSH